MKTAVSIPDPIFEAADELARRKGVSRSELYASALENYLKKHGRSRIRETLDEVYSAGDSTLDAGLAALQRASLPPEEW